MNAQGLFAMIDDHSAAIMAISTVILVAVTIVYAWLTRLSVNELKLQRMNSAMPLLLVRRLPDDPIQPDTGGRSLARYYEFVNRGLGPALDAFVTVRVDRPSGMNRMAVSQTALAVGESTRPLRILPDDEGTFVAESICQDMYGRTIRIVESGPTPIEVRLFVNGRPMTKSCRSHLLQQVTAESDT